MILGIISVIIVVIAIFLYLIILGANRNKSDEEINQEIKEQINYLKKFERKS